MSGVFKDAGSGNVAERATTYVVGAGTTIVWGRVRQVVEVVRNSSVLRRHDKNLGRVREGRACHGGPQPELWASFVGV